MAGGGQGTVYDSIYYTKNKHPAEVYDEFRDVIREPYYWIEEERRHKTRGWKQTF